MVKIPGGGMTPAEKARLAPMARASKTSGMTPAERARLSPMAVPGSPLAAASPASAAGGAPVPPGDPGAESAIPGVGLYGQVMANAQNAYDKAVINSRSNLIRNLRGLGFDENGQVQGDNPYGEYQLGRRQAGQEAEAATNSAAGRHLGNFGGLADQQRNEATFRGGAAMAGTLQRAEGAGATSAGEIQEANYTLQDRLARAQIDAARQAIEDRAFNLATDPASAAAGTPTGAGAGTRGGTGPTPAAVAAAAKMTPAERARLNGMTTPKPVAGAGMTPAEKARLAAMKKPAPKFVAPQRRA